MRYIILLSLIWGSLVVHGTTGELALSFGISIEQDAHQLDSGQLHRLLRTALGTVRDFVPPGHENNLFHWSEDRSVLEGKSLSLHLTTSQNPILAPLLDNSNSSNMDAFTLVPMRTTEKKMEIFLIILVDKVFFDLFGRERPDGFSRLIVALAHEIYGNVQHYLEFDIGSAKPQTMRDRVDQERKAFLVSISFLETLMASQEFNLMSEKLKNNFLRLLTSEQESFKSWQVVHPSQEEDPACRAMLHSLNH